MMPIIPQHKEDRMTNRILYYDRNFTERMRNPDIKPDYVYAIFTLSCFYHLASFRTREQMEAFAETLGFTYSWDEETGKGMTSLPIYGNAVDKDVSDSRAAMAYGISDLNMANAKTFKSLSNGHIVDNLFVNNGKEIRIYRCNGNYKDFYKPLDTDEHISFQQKHGVY